MLSQPDPPTSLAVRGASSVVSRPRPSLSRTRRYNRSHAGVGSASSSSYYAPQNDFPVFSLSGDVDILVRAGSIENRYLLHRHTLTRCSGFFEASTSHEWSRARALPSGHELARIGEDGLPGAAADRDEEATPPGSALDASPRKRWRYELDPGDGHGDIPMLVQKDPDQSAGARKGSGHSLPSIFGPTPGHGSGSDIGPRGASNGHPLSRPKDSNTHTRSYSSSATSTQHPFFRSVANLSLTHQHKHPPPSSSSSAAAPPPSEAEEDLLRDYDNLLRIFYNYAPVLDGVSVADAYVQCKSLLTLADQYDALAVVGPRVDHHLLQFQSRLWKQIAKYPISYLRLGYLARSKVIFQEALVHVVGQWPLGERSLRAALPRAVLDVIEDKVDELDESVSRVEGRLFRLGLVTSRGERVSPATSYLDWLAVSLFRQWLADNTTPPQPQPPSTDRSRHNRPPPPIPPQNTVGRAYRTLGSGNPASFLGRDECKRFLKLTPEMYSRDSLRRFERRMDELKSLARDVVRPLMGSALELDMGGTRSGAADGIGYLTCTAVGNRDLPWLVDD